MGHLPAQSPTPFLPWPRTLPSCPTPHTAPPVRGARRALGLRSRRFRCLFTANCLCRKMLVTRAERFRPALVDPAGGSSLIPPAKPRRNRRQGGGCVPPRARPPALLRTPGRGSLLGRRASPGPGLGSALPPAATGNAARGGGLFTCPSGEHCQRRRKHRAEAVPETRLLHSKEDRHD